MFGLFKKRSAEELAQIKQADEQLAFLNREIKRLEKENKAGLKRLAKRGITL